MTRYANTVRREVMDLKLSRALFWERKAADARDSENRCFAEILLHGRK